MLREVEIEVLREHTEALKRYAAAVELHTQYLKTTSQVNTSNKRRERGRVGKWLYASEVVDRLRPFVSETQVLKIMRETGLYKTEEYTLKGRTYFYSNTRTEQLLKLFQSNQLEPIKRK